VGWLAKSDSAALVMLPNFAVWQNARSFFK
jgi:hypothetical protein